MKTTAELKTIFEGLTFSEGDDTLLRFIEMMQAIRTRLLAAQKMHEALLMCTRHITGEQTMMQEVLITAIRAAAAWNGIHDPAADYCRTELTQPLDME